MNVPTPLRSRHLAPGDKLGKYELIRQIAIGGMAELYLARTVGIEGFEKLVVVKRILPQFASNQSFVGMFTNEARLAATLHHPNIAQVYDIGVEDGDYFFAMEYVHGEDLDRIQTQSHEQGVPVSMDAALALITGLCAGLHYAHEKLGPDGQPQQIVHRDVSPSNVLVSYDGSVKLVDFGIARAFAGKTTTTRGGLKGKIIYMSPEQCRSDSVLDRRSDIYSIGTLLYELTTGRTPFTGETEYAVLNQIVNADVPPPTRLVPNYPLALERILLRALARDPMHRYTTSLELQGELEDFAHESRLRVSPLVLARLMGTLFPARLEEWDNAKSQGAFFVEQHVLRTLIESGKTPDPNDPVMRQQVKVMQQQISEEDPTAVSHRPLDGPDTIVGPAPIADTAPLPLPPPPPRLPAMMQMRATPPKGMPPQRATPPGAQPIARAATPPGAQPVARAATPPGAQPVARAATPPGAQPVARQTPQAHPIMPLRAPTPLPVGPANAGVLVSHPADGVVWRSPTEDGIVRGHPPTEYEVTARVRVPTPTNFVRARRNRKPIIAVTALVLVGGGIAAFIAFNGSSTPSAQTTVEKAPESVKAEPVEPAKVEPAKVEAAKAEPVEAAKVEPAKVEPAKVEPAKVEPAKVEPAKVEPPPAKIAEPEPKKIVHVAVKPKPKAKPSTPPKPEEKPWNADSPFMPVRTDKH